MEQGRDYAWSGPHRTSVNGATDDQLRCSVLGHYHHYLTDHMSVSLTGVV